MTQTLTRIMFIVACVLTTSAAWAQEKVVLNEAIVKPAVTEFSIRYFAIDLEHERVLIELKSNTGELKQVIYQNSAPATTTTIDASGKSVETVTPSDFKGRLLIRALNRANFSLRSMEASIHDRLIKDGYIVGVVAGTPR